jgi:ABC-type lipoprotein release transport system permease subunit
MIRYVLYISVLIIFAVALVVINNALVMTTLERIAEIGTLRAVGAQRRFLLGMLVVEALAVGGLFGGIGSALGAGIVAILRMVGIPAFNDIFYFFFSGPRLHPGCPSPTSPSRSPSCSWSAAPPASTPPSSPCGSARARPCNPTSNDHDQSNSRFSHCPSQPLPASQAHLLLGDRHRGRDGLLVLLNALSTGVSDTMIRAATTLSSGHVNVGGFFKVTSSQCGPVVTEFAKVAKVVEENVPELAHWVHRGRGWAKIISDSGSMQVGVTGIDIKNEPDFKRVISVVSGRIEDLAAAQTMMVFESQVERLKVKVGDAVTLRRRPTAGPPTPSTAASSPSPRTWA